MSLIGCLGPIVPGSRFVGEECSHNAKVEPHYVVLGRRRLATDEAAIKAIRFVVSDATMIFNDPDAFGIVSEDTPDRLAAMVEAGPYPREVALGSHPTGAHFNGRHRIFLRPWLPARGYDADVVTKAIAELQRAARMDGLRVYEANRATCDMLRYGVQVTPAPGQVPVTVRFVDWDNPAINDLGLAEEVAVTAKNPKAYNKRPDLVMYVNGITLGVVELQKSTVDLGEGIRQTLDNQRPEFIRHFFTTVQITFAGNDMQGLRYARSRPRSHIG